MWSHSPTTTTVLHTCAPHSWHKMIEQNVSWVSCKFVFSVNNFDQCRLIVLGWFKSMEVDKCCCNIRQPCIWQIFPESNSFWQTWTSYCNGHLRKAHPRSNMKYPLLNLNTNTHAHPPWAQNHVQALNQRIIPDWQHKLPLHKAKTKERIWRDYLKTREQKEIFPYRRACVWCQYLIVAILVFERLTSFGISLHHVLRITMVRSDQENTSNFFCSIKHLLCTTHREKNTLVNFVAMVIGWQTISWAL